MTPDMVVIDDVTVDDVRQAINGATCEVYEPSEHWCEMCGAYTDEPLCLACERYVWLKQGGQA